MSIQIYKPNKNNTGFAFSFYMGENKKDGSPSLFINAISQHSWDNRKNIGSFSGSKDDPNKNISIKFNEFECGAIISAITNRYEWNTYHAYEENKTQIRLSPWDKQVTSTKINSKTKEPYQDTTTIPAFGLSLTRNGSQVFKIPLDPGESECIKALCSFILHKVCEKKNFNKTSSPEVKLKSDNYEF